MLYNEHGLFLDSFETVERKILGKAMYLPYTALRMKRLALFLFLPIAAICQDMKHDILSPRVRDAATHPPRKVLVATVNYHFHGDLDNRLATAVKIIGDAAKRAEEKHSGKRLDLVVLPENALQRVNDGTASERSLPLDHEAVAAIAEKARAHDTYVALGMILREGEENFNATVLFDRKGEVAGVYRKVHTVIDWEEKNPTITEGGMTPGKDFPVFECDFGRLGILICFDMAYPDGWTTLGERGAEIVVVPTASPQTLRPAMFAHLNSYYVVTSAWRDNASIFDPLGQLAAQVTHPGLLLHELDLSYAKLLWSPSLEDGQTFTKKYGDRVGFRYSSREDSGLFWSNDPKLPIGEMVNELGLRDRDASVELNRKVGASLRKKP